MPSRLALLLLVGAATAAVSLQAGQDGSKRERDLTPLERERLLAAQQRAEIRRKAAEEAERAAQELEAAARELEALAADAQAAATAARKRADQARVRADEARRTKRLPPEVRAPAVGAPAAGDDDRRRGVAPGRGEGDGASAVPPALPERAGTGSSDPAVAAAALPLSTFGEERARKMAQRILAGAERTAAQNKVSYLGAKRQGRGWDAAARTRGTGHTFPPGQAPDMGDMDMHCVWQWSLNVARGRGRFETAKPGQIKKTGHVDLARMTFQPDPSTYAKDGMKWGMRRYNLGDVTVTDCDFTDIHLEHGIYDNLSGHGLYRGNTFLRMGGQAIQTAYRDQPYQQYGADNLPYSAPPLLILEDNHAVDCGLSAGRAGFVWTLFDPGIPSQPGTVIVRGCTAVSAWDFTRTGGGDRVGPNHPRALRSAGGLVLTHYKKLPEDAPRPATRDFVMDACLLDLTMAETPVVAVRGVGTIHVEDSVFLARDHRRPFFDVDDAPGQPSGKVVLQNCVSPPGAEVWLRIGKKKVVSMHCPGRRLEIDVATRRVTETEPRDTPLTRVVSPLAGRRVLPGSHPQPPGHRDELGALDFSAVR